MNIAVWSKPACVYCDMAKRLLDQKGLEYTGVTLGEEFNRDDVVRRFPTAKTFPIIQIDNKYIGGYNELKALEDVCEYYNVQETSELTQEQVDEIFAYSESDDCHEGYVGMALRSICDQWEFDQDD